MPILVDPEKMREHFRAHTNYDPDDPDQERAMRAGFRCIALGSIPFFVGFVMVATTELLPALSVLFVGALMIGVGLTRFIALVYRR